ncbi:hypothetical protein Daus18300_006220 [Diaporthe australafricana]|uniref:Uncharacterized protein n=1 Tax=Diaporthe australafricana TaxID=127596 RepID=A0ABR3WVI3_9PEZI
MDENPVDRTPRTYMTTAPGRDSYLARPPPVHETSLDSKSWSQQTEDALDAYKQGAEKYQIDGKQTLRAGYDLSSSRTRANEKSSGTKEKMDVHVAEYRLDSDNGDAPNEAANFGPSQISQEKTPVNYYATYIEAAELESATDETLETNQNPPKNHRMTKMIVKEDIEFFTAVLEGHSPPVATKETQTFVHDETETLRQSQEFREREADLRRREEADAAKADTDFFMMLMHKE